MKKLEHENIVKLNEVIEDNENDKIYLGKNQLKWYIKFIFK